MNNTIANSISDTAKYIREQCKELEQLTHKKETHFTDDLSIDKIEIRIEKHSIVASMYIGKNFFI
jgi:hypothetical protein